MVELEKIKEQMMSRIDTGDYLEVEKVQRYIGLVQSYRDIEATIIEEGYSVETVNVTQRFIKPHPLLNDKNKVNTSIINTERSIRFMDDDEGKQKFSASDLM